MPSYDFVNLSKENQRKYDDFRLLICSNNSPLSKMTNEENLRSVFENELNKLLRILGFIDTGYEFFQHESANDSGRTDCQYSNTIIEYKRYNLLSKPSKLSEFQNQIKDYLKDSKFSGFKMFGFLFDGVSLYSYTKDENDTIIYNENDSGKLNSQNLDKLIKTLFSSGIVAISPNNLKRDFGILDKNDNVLDGKALDFAKHLLKILTNSQNVRTGLLFSEWEKLFRLAENDNGKHQDIADRREVFSRIFGKIIDKDSEYKALFALHTTLSVIIKLLLVRIINDMPQISQRITLDDFYKENSLEKVRNFFITMENGAFFKKIGVINLTDNDFFAWYIKEEFNAELKDILQGLIFKICSYENICLTKHTAMLDMFKELYLSFIPKCVRHSFGEYYTPYWLAERTFMSATDKDRALNSKTFIDPSCGSGTFLSVFFNHKHKNLNTNIDFADFVNGIVGVDINPIAVLMARANILIQAIKRCSFNITQKYEIPVYLADSLYVPNLVQIDSIECYDYELYTTGLQRDFDIDKVRLILPRNLVLNAEFMSIIAEIEKHIVNLDKNSALKCFEKHCVDIKSKPNLRKKIENNVDELIKFEQKELNSIWLKIFSNYFRVATFDKFDYIIGNPAWVQWSVLPEAYRNNIKENMRMDGLFSSDKNVGGNNLNICALIANKCCERWLKDDGKFAFLMPKSILFNKSFEGFRNLIINSNERLYFNEVVDFSKGGEIFDGVGLDFCCFKISKSPNTQSDIVPFCEYFKKPSLENATHNDEWEKVRGNFTIKNNFAVQLKTHINNNFLVVDSLQRANHLKTLIGECEYQFRKGVSVEYPMRLEFVRLSSKELGVFYPYTKIGNRLKVDKSQEITLELKYIKPFITAPMLTDEQVAWENSYCICPYAPNTKQPIAKDELKSLAPHIYRYLDDIDDKLGKGSDFNKRVQNFVENYGILRMGSYVWAEHFACIRDNTKLAPSYVGTIKTHWGESISPLFDNHISFVSEVILNKKESRFIDKDETMYIVERLKDKDINEIIINSQDSRSISSRLPVKLPYFKRS